MKRADLIEALRSVNLRAFLAVIRAAEGTPGEAGYRRMFGGKLFESFEDHPRQPQTFKLKGKPLTSTAAGAYQFLSRTWDGLVKQYGFTDFGPEHQDQAAVALIAGRRALQDAIAGRIEAAIRKCNREWASLPGSPYGQPVKTLAQCLAVYEAAGGKREPDAPIKAAPIEPPKGSTMAPFLPLALEAIMGVVPDLLNAFKGEKASEVATRNIKVATTVVEAAKEALSVRNEQELIEAIQEGGPEVAVQLQQAVRSIWYEVTADTSGVQAAREANIALMATGQPFWLNPAFVISILILAMPFMLLIDVFYVHPETYSGELRVQIVTGILTIISLVSAYWIGTSYSSARKTELGVGQK